MRGQYVFVHAIVAVVLITGAHAVSAQTYPTKPVRIVTANVGGGTDFVSRLIAQGISGPLGQQVIVDNRASGVIPGDIVAKAAPDGYTLLVAGGILWIAPLLQKTPYDPLKDFAPITLPVTAPAFLVVHPSLPVKSVRQLVALAKSRPGELNYGSTGTGSSTHLAAELFKSMAGVNIVRIPYKGGGPATVGLIGGEVQLMFATAGSVTPHVKSGKLRMLAVTSARPSALAPDLPTIAASGLPGYEADTTYAVLAPAGTPAAIVKQLNHEIVRALNRPDMREKFLNAGVDVVGSTPEQLTAAMSGEVSRLGKVIRDAGIRIE